MKTLEIVKTQEATKNRAGNNTISEEDRSERVRRLYAEQGGPLVGWLLDEARRRGHELKQMARELGVTYGYIHQLRTGLRSLAHISQEFADACAEYLGCPTIIVKLLSGRICVSDFAFRGQTKQDTLDRALRQVQDDPQIRRLLPCNLQQLPREAKEVIVLLYSETSCRDIFDCHELPAIVRWLQRAAIIHDESEAEALRGHRAFM